MRAFWDWLDDRTGFRRLSHEVLFERVPGGARWRYVWGSTLTFALVVQIMTGLVLWTAYSANAHGAWESVYYIQHHMTGGWFLRGLHHYTAELMVVLLGLHLMQVVVDGAYKAPREINFWMGLGMLGLVLVLCLTGYLLPWDQKGYWATKVATSIAAITPVIGPELQKLIIGGAEYGHHTLTRFFALHAGLVPATMVLFLIGHVYLFRRHGLTAKQPLRKPDTTFWPDQVLCDAVACLAVMATVIFLILWTGGAALGAPADPSEPYAAARPEWYYLFLFQFLKYFPAGLEVWGAILIPGLVVLLVVSMPFIGRWRLGHRFNLGMVGVLGAGVLLLTYLALAEDRANPEYRRAQTLAEQQAARAKNLAGSPRGIPEKGAVFLLREDPLTQGPRLFAQHCASCHRYDGHDGTGRIPADPPSAADLKGFASRPWVTGLLDPQTITNHHYFGATAFADGKMVRFVTRDVARFDPAQQAQLAKVVLALSAEAGLKAQRALDQNDAEAISQGRELLNHEDMRCTECHDFHGVNEDPSAPDLTGYGSRWWLIGIISNPAHERYYGRRNDRMPAFGEQQILPAQSIGLVADWLRGDWYEPENPLEDH